ncbi:RraA family protein [Piscinibacter koreensis]|uniref:Putative 4-hydroxy-4-methyl-2-oxoglutarate aldolase n=1 Tax=Piscinibacter koreensis TaxID=2742824 RepID=A0A7Y6NRI9_9BURK|nr:RraA family protein [Schlegelella koreensis]NUZ08009.1 RraA family protein [Schlegelella koreensis]
MNPVQPADFAEYAAATVYEAAGKAGEMAPHIRPVGDAHRLLGRAFTVRCWPSDGLAFMRAVEMAAPGDVLVIDGGGTDRSTVWGGSATIRAKYRGLAGVVTNGAVRDVATIRELGFPVWAAGICVRGGVANHPGWHNGVVSVGDVAVAAGDIVVADIDGVVVVPAGAAAEVLEKTRAQHAKERGADERLRNGGSYDDVLRWYQALSKPDS